LRVAFRAADQQNKAEAMVEQKKAERFKFMKALRLVEVTQLKASSLGELLTCITLADNPSLFYHLHEQFFRHPDVLPEYPNDFASWTGEVLGSCLVAEQLANINLFRTAELGAIRREISVIVAEHLRQTQEVRVAPAGREFNFCRPQLVVIPCGLYAASPAEFVKLLKKVDIESIGYHLFEPKAAPGPTRNDFSQWFYSLGYKSLAHRLDSFDPYLNCLEDNRSYLAELIETELQP